MTLSTPEDQRDIIALGGILILVVLFDASPKAGGLALALVVMSMLFTAHRKGLI